MDSHPPQDNNRQVATLFISDLDKSITEQDLLTFFHEQTQDNSLKSCKVVRDHNPPNISLGYGYLNFASQEVARHVLDTLNYKIIGQSKKQYRLSPQERDPTRRKTQYANLYITNLPPNTTPEQLHEHFSKYGSIFSVKIGESDKPDQPLRGYVRFDTQDEADAAKEKANNSQFNNNVITVQAAISHTNPTRNEVFITGYPETTTEDILRAALNTYGEVTQIDMRTATEKYPKGYAYVWFKEEEHAAKCVDQLNGKPSLTGAEEKKEEPAEEKKEEPAEEKKEEPAEEKKEEKPEAPVKVSIYHPKWERVQYKRRLKEQTRKRNLYVRDFPTTFSDADLRSIFEKFGEITSCLIMKNQDGGSRGFGFCCFATDQAARSAWMDMDGKEIPREGGEAFTLYVNYAIPKDEYQTYRKTERQNTRTKPPHPRYPRQMATQSPAGYPGMMPPFFPVMPTSPASQMPTPNGGMNSPSSPYYRQYNPNLSSPPPAMMVGPQSPYPLPGKGYRRPQYPQYPGRIQPIPPYMYQYQMMLQMMRGGMQPPMAYQQPVHNSGNSPLPGVMTTGSPSSTAASTNSPNSAGGYAPQVNSPTQGAQTSSPKSAGQPGTPTSGSMPSSPDSGATSSLGGSPSTQPQLQPIYVDQQQLASIPPDQQKNNLGELLFPRISILDQANAGKITGMLLELDVAELINLLQDPRELRSKVQEAQLVLQEAQQQQPIHA